MFCPICGASVPDGAAFCGKCGTDLSRVQSPGAGQPETAENSSGSQQTTGSEQGRNHQPIPPVQLRTDCSASADAGSVGPAPEAAPGGSDNPASFDWSKAVMFVIVAGLGIGSLFLPYASANIFGWGIGLRLMDTDYGKFFIIAILMSEAESLVEAKAAKVVRLIGSACFALFGVVVFSKYWSFAHSFGLLAVGGYINLIMSACGAIDAILGLAELAKGKKDGPAR